MSDNGDFWKAYISYVARGDPADVVGPADSVGPAVLAQVLGPQLVPGEDVTCSRFVRSTGGRLLGRSGHGAHVVIVTDRRVMRATARESVAEGYDSTDPATFKWPSGTPIDEGFLTRWSVWLGQIHDVECRWSWGQARLALSTADGREQWVAGQAETIVALEAAIRRALDGPGRWTLPPPSHPRPSVAGPGGWWRSCDRTGRHPTETRCREAKEATSTSGPLAPRLDSPVPRGFSQGRSSPAPSGRAPRARTSRGVATATRHTRRGRATMSETTPASAPAKRTPRKAKASAPAPHRRRRSRPTRRARTRTAASASSRPRWGKPVGKPYPNRSAARRAIWALTGETPAYAAPKAKAETPAPAPRKRTTRAKGTPAK